MEVYTEFEGKTMVFRLVGELDEHSAEFVRRKLDAAISENSYDAVLLDLSRLSFMDSTGIGVVIGRYKLIRKENKRVYVRNPSPTVDKIFRMSGLYEIITKL
ncbi:MAG: anti-sigma factor antagonist [Clostridiales bacterium]|nr:anti-sigma factor antagonist [Clostridiales bacterium]